MKTLTVFTPTFNRAYTLHLGYEALKSQTSKDFKWLIIDDGSSDNTKELVDTWIKEGIIEIEYVYKENGGMHTAHNKAYELIDTELNVCIDSDDYMPKDAVQLIVEKWKKDGNDSYAGIVGLDVKKDGCVIGLNFSNDLFQTTLSGYYYNGGIGDKKVVLRSDVVNKYPRYPIFKEEKFVPLGTLYLMIDQDYMLLVLNEPLCIVEYMPDGSTLNIYNQYIKNPKGFRYSRDVELKYSMPFLVRIKKNLHRISSTIIIGDFNFFKNNPDKITTFLVFPFGLLFHIFIKYNIFKYSKK